MKIFKKLVSSNCLAMGSFPIFSLDFELQVQTACLVILETCSIFSNPTLAIVAFFLFFIQFTLNIFAGSFMLSQVIFFGS